MFLESPVHFSIMLKFMYVCKKTPGYHDHIWNPDLCSAHDFINFKWNLPVFIISEETMILTHPPL